MRIIMLHQESMTRRWRAFHTNVNIAEANHRLGNIS